ncbi:MAG TPA: response regulator [Falsiroseomonas sp.]|jgi:CheY-like chemotaxis protein|nr:response regulator [Falsiroseomonas sp.]
MRVLLAEDEGIIALLLQDVLEAAGHTVVAASDGQAAVALAARAGPFDALVTDLNMPRLGGAELIRRLRGDRPSLPVVVLTGSPPREGVSVLARAGEPPVVLLLKPVAPEDLLRGLARAIAAIAMVSMPGQPNAAEVMQAGEHYHAPPTARLPPGPI